MNTATTLRILREKTPLIHNITNYVAMNSTANALLAIGVAPVMVHASLQVAILDALYQLDEPDLHRTNVADIIRVDADGIAVVSAIRSAKDSQNAAHRLKTAIHGARESLGRAAR